MQDSDVNLDMQLGFFPLSLVFFFLFFFYFPSQNFSKRTVRKLTGLIIGALDQFSIKHKSET